MTILLTGATGFLGRYVVEALRRRGHHVRALVRPATDIDHLGWRDDRRISIVRADLRATKNLAEAVGGVDAVIHLAASVTGDEQTQFTSAAVGTERLLAAMAETGVCRMVLASSLSVYRYRGIGRLLTEECPVESHVYDRGGYTIAKCWQERICRRAAEWQGLKLTVLRPGYIWGPNNEYAACLCKKFGRLHPVIAPFSRLPLTHVENCANAFLMAVENEQAVDETFNVVDDDAVRTWSYVGQYLRRKQLRGIRLPVPYWIGSLAAHIAEAAGQWLFHGNTRMPGLLVPCRFEARFKPLRHSNQKIKQKLRWHPPLSYRQCLERTYGKAPAPEAPSGRLLAEASTS